MTEAEWLACTDAQPLLSFLVGTASARKLRLIACGCCRQIWDRLTDERSRRAVEVAERFADGLATSGDLLAASHAAYDAAMAAASTHGPNWAAAGAAADTSNPEIARRVLGDGGAVSFAAYKAKSGRRLRQCQVIWDIMGPLPFRPVAAEAAWLTWNGGMVTKLARGIYEERAYDRLPVLADALEEAGCAEAELLGHLRSAGPHVRGCWALDLILGKG